MAVKLHFGSELNYAQKLCLQYVYKWWEMVYGVVAVCIGVFVRPEVKEWVAELHSLRKETLETADTPHTTSS